MNRRRFLESGLGAIAATAASRVSTDQQVASAKAGVDFDFTGLFTFRFARSQKEMGVLLLDSKRTKLKDQHIPMLMMPLEAWHYIPPADKGYRAPSIIRFGDKAMAVWSLSSQRLWVHDAHTTFPGNDPDASLKWNESPIGECPDPIDKDAGWASLKWFAGFRTLLGGKYEQDPNKEIKLKDKKLTTEIRLTRGDAAGRAPKLKCEQYRKYKLGNDTKTRSYATQMHVEYYLDNTDVLKLAITGIQFPGTDYQLIGVKIKANELTPVSILNVPLTHGHKPHHYTAFYNMVGAKGKEVTPLACEDECKSGIKLADAGSLPSSPDPDCIPPYWPNP